MTSVGLGASCYGLEGVSSSKRTPVAIRMPPSTIRPASRGGNQEPPASWLPSADSPARALAATLSGAAVWAVAAVVPAVAKPEAQDEGGGEIDADQDQRAGCHGFLPMG